MYQRTLHDAMRLVLTERPEHEASTSDLSEEIERRSLYVRKDGAAARAQQINARARKYPNLFELDNSGMVRLLSTSSASESAA
jgi:antitoxin Phd